MKFMVILPRWHELEREERARVMDGEATAEGYGAILERGAFDAYQLDAQALGEVFEVLNIAHPADYRLRSLSVGDLIVAHDHDSRLKGGVTVVAGIGYRTIVLPGAWNTAAKQLATH